MSYRKAAGKSNKTPWTKPKQASVLTSDALKPRRPQNPPSSASGNKASKGKDPPKSRELRDIEATIEAVEGGVSDQTNEAGCFCLARTHNLSPYVPLCPYCGLIMCELQNPSSPCPSCLSPVLSPAERSALLSRLQGEKQAILQREAEQREAERLEQLRQQVILAGGGEFPTLAISASATVGGSPMASGTSTPRSGIIPGGVSGRQTPVHPQDEGPHKVLSLNSRTKKVTVSTYTQPSVHNASQPTKLLDDKGPDKEARKPIPPPPDEVVFITAQRPSNRKWLDLRGDGLTYIPLQPTPAPSNKAEESKSNRRRNRGKGKGKEKSDDKAA